MVELTELEAELGPEYNGPAREELGRAVRDVWLYWAVNQPDKEKHPNWFLSWEQLEERDREVDRMIGGAIYLRAKEKIVKADQQRQAAERREIAAERAELAARLRELVKFSNVTPAGKDHYHITEIAAECKGGDVIIEVIAKLETAAKPTASATEEAKE